MSNDIEKLEQLRYEFDKTLNFYGLSNLNQIFSKTPQMMMGHVGKEMNILKLGGCLIGEGTSIKLRNSSDKEWFVYGFKYPYVNLKKKLNNSFKTKKLWIGIKSVVISSVIPQDVKPKKDIRLSNRNKIIIKDQDGDKEINLKDMENALNLYVNEMKSDNKTIDNKTIWFDSLESTPIYISSFFKIARKYYKSSYIIIMDNLPNNITYLISPHLNLKHHKSSVLKHILYAISDNDDEEFLNNTLDQLNTKNKSFEECIDSIIKKSGINYIVNDNRCLACGNEIKMDGVFCYESRIYKKGGRFYKSNKDGCRNKYRTWQRARLGIINLSEQKKVREQHARELKHYVMTNRLGAFEKFKKKHSKLYERRNAKQTF